MAVDLELARRPNGRPGSRLCTRTSSAITRIARALDDQVRLQLVDVRCKHAGKACVCALVPLFDVSQPTVSHHLKVLRTSARCATS